MVLKNGEMNSARAKIFNFFQSYRERNDQIIKHLNVSLEVLSKIENSPPPKLFKYSSLVPNFGVPSKKVMDLYKNLKNGSLNSLSSDIRDLISVIEEENEKLKYFFSNSTIIEDVKSIFEFEGLCISYNSQKRSLFSRISSYVPSIKGLGTELTFLNTQLKEINHEIYSGSAHRFMTFFSEFINSILLNKSYSDVFVSFGICLDYLNQYIRDYNVEIYGDISKGFIKAVNQLRFSDFSKISFNGVGIKGNQDAQLKDFVNCFLNNYFNSSGSLGKQLMSQFEELKNDFNWSDGTINVPYSKVNNDDGKVDKFLRSSLKSLFNCSFRKNGVLKKSLDKFLEDKGEVRDLIKEIEGLMTSLVNKFTKFGIRFVGEKGYVDLIFQVSNGSKSYKKIIEDENMNDLKSLKSILEVLLQEKKNDDSWKSFIDLQVGILMTSSQNGSSNDDVLNKKFEGGTKIDIEEDEGWKKAFNGLVDGALEQSVAILDHNFSPFDNNNRSDVFNLLLSYIKSIGINLNRYFDLKGNELNDDEKDNIVDDLVSKISYINTINEGTDLEIIRRNLGEGFSNFLRGLRFV